MQRSHTVRAGCRVAGALAVLLVMAACGSDDGSDSGATSGSGAATSATGSAAGSGSAAPESAAATDAVDTLADALAATEKAQQGTDRAVDPTPRAAVKGKRVVVISLGQAAISAQIPSDAAVEAAKAIGWEVDLYDAQINPANWAPLIRQAIAAGVDGILLDAIDCPAVRQPLEEAKAKGIAVVTFYGFDCNDQKTGGAGDPLFSAAINFGPKAAAGYGQFSSQYAADQANYIIADSENKAKIIVVHDPTYIVLHYTRDGFKETIEASGGAEIVSTIEISSSDITSNKLVAKLQAEFLRHPEADWIKSPYTYATTIGIVPALGARAGEVKVMGGEGFAPELDLLREGKVSAVNMISSQWVAWAAVDTMNSFFRGEPPADSGIGWTIADATHNVPPAGEFSPPVDFRAAYQKAWGITP